MMFRRVCIITISAILLGLSNGAALAKCMNTAQVLDLLRAHTLTGKSISSGKTWKAYFRAGGPVTYLYSSGNSDTFRWFVKNGIILIKTSTGKESSRRKVCGRPGNYYWTDARTGRKSSRIVRSSRGNKLRIQWAGGAQRSIIKPRQEKQTKEFIYYEPFVVEESQPEQSVRTISTSRQDNRFLVAKDFLVNFTWEDAGNGYFIKGTATASFYINNIADRGIWVYVSPSQARSFHINHPIVNGCSQTQFSGIPEYPKDIRFDKVTAKRIAVYIPSGSGVFVTVEKDACKFAGQESFYRGRLRGGIVSGNVTIIKGRQNRTRPISGRF